MNYDAAMVGDSEWITGTVLDFKFTTLWRNRHVTLFVFPNVRRNIRVMSYRQYCN